MNSLHRCSHVRDVLFYDIQLVACSIISRFMLSLTLTNDAVHLNLLILFHLLGHVTCILFSNVAFISDRIDDVTAKHTVTCCDLSQHVEKSLITLSNKDDACEIANCIFIVLYYIDDVIARCV